MNLLSRFLALLFFIMLSFCSSAQQDTTPAVEKKQEMPSKLRDSLIRDSLLEQYILSHRSLTKNELDRFVLLAKPGTYSKWAMYYFEKSGMLKIRKNSGQDSIVRLRPPREWIFYSFAFLFLFLGLANRLFKGYLQKLLRAYFNEGFVYRQARDQIMQIPQASLLFNLFFVLTTALFIYFGLLQKTYSGPDRWLMIFLIAGCIVLIYLIKLIFLRWLGWIFSSRDLMENYTFVVFMNSKLVGILFLLSSFLMAFSEKLLADQIFNGTLYVAGLFFLFRFFKGFIIFSKQKNLGFFSLLLAFLSLELLPAALLIKFILRESGYVLSILV